MLIADFNEVISTEHFLVLNSLKEWDVVRGRVRIEGAVLKDVASYREWKKMPLNPGTGKAEKVKLLESNK